ncbi:MAG: transposase [Anaerolineales bacterium]|nr:transposase [Anaerolineales bacterium]
MFRTYKYLLRPTVHQAQALDYLLWQSRLIYNAALEQRIQTYQETGQGITYAAQWIHFRDLRRANPETCGLLNASSLQQLLRRLDKAFQAFFRRVKAGETPGFPRFKGRNRFKSIEYTYGDGCKLRANQQGQWYFYIQNVGEVRMCFHRGIPQGAQIKHVVIKCINQRWYACLMLELPDVQIMHPKAEKAVGVDVGLFHLLALSDHQAFNNPRWLRKSLARLRILQRQASRRQKGSQRQRESYAAIARLHEQIANQRRDYLHKVTAFLVQEYSLIAIEELSRAFMNQNDHLSLSSHDAGLGEFRQLLQYKAEEAGAEVVAVNPAFTSQRCSGCGEIVEKSLSIRVHECPTCGLVLDRDVNAARNILKLALENPPGRGGQEITWPIGACVS